MPSSPITKKVTISPISNPKIYSGGYYLDETSATNLADNVEELKAYAEKLEVLIKNMKKYYGSK